MLPTTNQAIRSILKTDPTLSPEARSRIVQSIRGSEGAPPAPPKGETILRRGEVATRMNRTTRFVDQLASQGILNKVFLPGRTRAVGFREADVESLITGEQGEA